jgi:hypothetical protein
MKITEIKEKLREIKKTLAPLIKQEAELNNHRYDLIKRWQGKCRHTRVEEYVLYMSGGYDYSDSTDKKRKCMSCGLVEKAKEIYDRPQYYSSEPRYVYKVLTAQPVEKFYGKPGEEYYFAPHKRPAAAEKFL